MRDLKAGVTPSLFEHIRYHLLYIFVVCVHHFYFVLCVSGGCVELFGAGELFLICTSEN